MKIAIFSDNFYPEISGISDSIVLIAKELAKKGHQINFYVPRYGHKDFLISKLEPAELKINSNIKIFRLPSLPYPLAPTKQGRLVLPFLHSFSDIKEFNPDIIYTQDFFGAGFEAFLISKILKKPLVGTNHTPITEFLKYSPIKLKWLNNLTSKYVSWYYNQCLLVTAPSQSILTEMKKYGLATTNFPLSNPIDLSNFNPVNTERKNELKKKFNFSSYTILYTGRLGEEKNIDIIIRALAIVKKNFPTAMLAITGHGSAENNLRKLTRELDLENNIKFLGFVESETFAQIYQASDIFTIMSGAETQCMSMMQAMATGLPVIGANAWGVPEYIQADNGYIVELGDFKMLAEKISYLFNNPDVGKRLGANGLDFVKDFSPEKIINRWEKILQNEINKRKLKLSIVIPAYNEESHLPKCLESTLEEVKKMPDREIEIIVVNNASTDHTREIILSYPGVKLVDEPIKGLPMARQAGFMASTGDIIANIDSDTVMMPGWINKVFSEFENNENLAALSGPYIYYDRSQKANMAIWAIYYFPAYLIHLINHHVFKIGAILQGGNFILRRSHLEKVGGFNTKIEFYGEDADIARRIQKVGLVKFSFLLPMPTSARRLAKEGIVATAVKYILNYFSIVILKKPFKYHYTYVGESKETDKTEEEK